MTPGQIVDRLSPNAPDYQLAAEALGLLLRRLSQGYLLEPITRKRYLIPLEEREDIVSSVWLNLIERAQQGILSLSEKSDSAFRKYCSTSLVRLWLSQTTRRASEKLREERFAEVHTPETVPAEAEPPGREVEELRERAWHLTGVVFQEYLQRSPKRYRSTRLQLWNELRSRSYRKRSAATGLSKAAASRWYKSRQRLKEGLSSACDEMERCGQLDTKNAHIVRNLLCNWL